MPSTPILSPHKFTVTLMIGAQVQDNNNVFLLLLLLLIKHFNVNDIDSFIWLIMNMLSRWLLAQITITGRIFFSDYYYDSFKCSIYVFEEKKKQRNKWICARTHNDRWKFCFFCTYFAMNKCLLQWARIRIQWRRRRWRRYAVAAINRFMNHWIN